MNDRSAPVFDEEERTTLALLDALSTRSSIRAVGDFDDEVMALLRRMQTEAFGLMAYSLEPIRPSPGIRDLLLAQIAGEETQEVEPIADATFDTLSSDETLPFASSRLAPAVAATRANVSEPPSAGRAPRRGAGRWGWALAALFALAAIGLGAWGAMLDSQLATQRLEVAALATRLEKSATLERDLVAARAAIAALEGRMTFVTSPAVTVFALRPAGERPGQPLARGHLYVSADRRRWHLEVRGLTPEPTDRDYQLWFLIDGNPIGAGTFDSRQGIAAVLAAEQRVPEGTNAVAITLERRGGAPRPTSPPVLVADRAVVL